MFPGKTFHEESLQRVGRSPATTSLIDHGRGDRTVVGLGALNGHRATGLEIGDLALLREPHGRLTGGLHGDNGPVHGLDVDLRAAHLLAGADRPPAEPALPAPETALPALTA